MHLWTVDMLALARKLDDRNRSEPLECAHDEDARSQTVDVAMRRHDHPAARQPDQLRTCRAHGREGRGDA